MVIDLNYLCSVHWEKKKKCALMYLILKALSGNQLYAGRSYWSEVPMKVLASTEITYYTCNIKAVMH